MKHLQRAFHLAEERGYLAYPEVRALEQSVPAWFHRMSDPSHQADFERRYQLVLPAVLKEFYACIPLACFLEACYPEVFLIGYAEQSGDEELPPLVEWKSGRYLVTGFHNHSGMVSAVALNGEADPPEVQGFQSDEDHATELPEPFSAAIFGLVERYDSVLDELARMYRDAADDPKTIARVNIDWILDTPGIRTRLPDQP